MSTPLRFFRPPADLDDFGAPLRAIWHQRMSGWFDDEIALVAGQLPPAACQYYNPSRIDPGTKEIVVPVTWLGFPKVLLTLYDESTAYAKAEVLATFGQPDAAGEASAAFRDPMGNDLKLPYRVQDEYLEWRVERDPVTRKVVRITFTCEGPEYWQILAKYDRPKLLELYRRFVDPDVRWEDLVFQSAAVDGNTGRTFEAGEYNPRNKWNTTCGIMHLTHRANTLRGEIELAGDATMLYLGVGGEKFLKDPIRLLCCAGMGNANRFSDPQIAGNVNGLARLGAHVGLQIPVGLYIDQVDPNIITDEKGRPVSNLFRVLRGKTGGPGNETDPSRILRMECALPPEDDRVLGDLFVDGRRIDNGGQLAAHIHMRLSATYFGPGTFRNDAVPCGYTGWRMATNPDIIQLGPVGTGAPSAGFERAFSRRERVTAISS